MTIVESIEKEAGTVRVILLVFAAMAFAGLSGCGSGGSGGSGRDQASDDGSVLVSWSPPEKNEDGSDLDFAAVWGYRVYWSSVPGACDYPSEVFFVDKDADSTEIDGLSSGRHYFAMTTVMIDGTESGCSDEVSSSFFGE